LVHLFDCAEKGRKQRRTLLRKKAIIYTGCILMEFRYSN